MPILESLKHLCRTEWERILASVAGLAFLIAAILAGITAASWLKTEKPALVRDVAARKAYQEYAFAFLSQQRPSSDIGGDHAFSVKPPAGWRQGEPPEVSPPIAEPDRTIAMDDLLRQLRSAIPASLRSAKLVKPPPAVPKAEPKVPVKTTPAVVKKRPPPPPPRYVTYQGIIRTAEGREMALLTVEDTSDGSRKASYATAGTRVADGALRIIGFNNKGIRCRTATGAIVTVPYGGKQQIR